MKIHPIAFVVASFFVSACSLLGANRQTGVAKPLGPQVKDVPYEARETRDGKDMSLRKRVMVLPFLDTAGARDSRSSMVAGEAFIRQLRQTDDLVVVV